MNHLRENNFALSNLKMRCRQEKMYPPSSAQFLVSQNEMSSIQYNGDKVILNVDLPERKPRPKEEPTRASFSVPCETTSEHWDPTDISDFLTMFKYVPLPEPSH